MQSDHFLEEAEKPALFLRTQGCSARLFMGLKKEACRRVIGSY